MLALKSISQNIIRAVPKGPPLPLFFKPDLVVQGHKRLWRPVFKESLDGIAVQFDDISWLKCPFLGQYGL